MACVKLGPVDGDGNITASYNAYLCVHAMSGEADDTNDALGKQNDTGVPEQHSHLDAPSESVYMICGVLIAMVLVGVIIILLAVTISKLRKRDENHHSNVHPQDVVLQTTTTTTTTTGGVPTATVQTTISTISGQTQCPEQMSAAGNGNGVYPPQFLWQYPAQYSLYSNDQDSLVHTLPAERPGFCRGFRKNLRGRWRRLVKRKPAQEAYTIPAELRDQLKQIYVY